MWFTIRMNMLPWFGGNACPIMIHCPSCSSYIHLSVRTHGKFRWFRSSDQCSDYPFRWWIMRSIREWMEACWPSGARWPTKSTTCSRLTRIMKSTFALSSVQRVNRFHCKVKTICEVMFIMPVRWATTTKPAAPSPRLGWPSILGRCALHSRRAARDTCSIKRHFMSNHDNWVAHIALCLSCSDGVMAPACQYTLAGLHCSIGAHLLVINISSSSLGAHSTCATCLQDGRGRSVGAVSGQASALSLVDSDGLWPGGTTGLSPTRLTATIMTVPLMVTVTHLRRLCNAMSFAWNTSIRTMDTGNKSSSSKETQPIALLSHDHFS